MCFACLVWKWFKVSSKASFGQTLDSHKRALDSVHIWTIHYFQVGLVRFELGLKPVAIDKLVSRCFNCGSGGLETQMLCISLMLSAEQTHVCVFLCLPKEHIYFQKVAKKGWDTRFCVFLNILRLHNNQHPSKMVCFSLGGALESPVFSRFP